MKLAWLTDIHLNFLDSQSRKKFYERIIDSQCDAVLISGDIAEAISVEELLNEMGHYIQKPIYFVLGNHDYYRGQVDEVRNAMVALTQSHPYLFWLPALGLKQLDNKTLLVGQDGWADGRYGDYEHSDVGLNDSRLIVDLFQKKILGRHQLLEKMQNLADVDAMRLKKDLIRSVAEAPKKVIVLTHVPPFQEACFHLGKMSDKEWLPFFSSKITGETLLEVAKQNPNIDFLVLCGHTHSEARFQPFENLEVEAGRAEYYHPAIQRIILT